MLAPEGSRKIFLEYCYFFKYNFESCFNSFDAGDEIFRLWVPIPCLLMNWLLKSTVHQQAWYWLCRTDNNSDNAHRYSSIGPYWSYGLVQDCSISSVLAVEILQSCSISHWYMYFRYIFCVGSHVLSRVLWWSFLRSSFNQWVRFAHKDPGIYQIWVRFQKYDFQSCFK